MLFAKLVINVQGYYTPDRTIYGVQVAQLEHAGYRLLRGEHADDGEGSSLMITKEQCSAISSAIDAFISDASPDASLSLGTNMRMIRW